MTRLLEVQIAAQPLERFAPLLPAESMREATQAAERLARRIEGRAVWNVNSTAVGGGVAEMLKSLLTYARGAGVDARWVVIEGSPEFFRITKRLHHALHGSRGDGMPLDARAHRIYEETLRANALELASVVRRGDILILHDPQTAGLAPHFQHQGVHLIWRCHIGHDPVDAEVEQGWDFLRPYLAGVARFVFSRGAYVPAFCDAGRARVIQPSIDAFSAKNQELGEEAVRAILVHTGLVEGPAPQAPPEYLAEDGSPRHVRRRVDLVRMGRAPSWETPLVVQVSRWDVLKDPIGVLRGFAALADGEAPGGAELVLAGPNVKSVADDPEGDRVFDDVEAAWRALPHAVRHRVQLASLPTADVEENAAIVNALQRHAAVVVQKSLHEGFGLTVTEAMWKGRAVLASAVGGIRDQIEDGVSGVLLPDPRDLEAFGAALRVLLTDPARRERMGQAARERVRRHFLGVRHLLAYSRLFEELEAVDEPRASR